MNGEFLFLLEFPIGVRNFAREFACLGANFFFINQPIIWTKLETGS